MGAQATISTKLGASALLLQGFTASERLSEPFTIVADVLSPATSNASGDIDFMTMLGSEVLLSVDPAADPAMRREFNGVLYEATRTDADRGGVAYRLVLRPWLLLLAGNQDTRMFENKTVLDIADAVFRGHGFSGYDLSGVAKPPVREYCVQYRESDLQFLSRLFEEEGLYYYFKHERQAHTMVLCEKPANHAAQNGVDKVNFYSGNEGRRAQPHFWAWDETLRPGAQTVTMRDSHFRNYPQNLQVQSTQKAEGAADVAEVYDYPGGYGYIKDDGTASGQPYAVARLQALRAQRRRFIGRGGVFAVATGAKLGLALHPDARFNADYLAVGTVHTLSGQTYGTGETGAGVSMEVEVEAIPFEIAWKPLQVTPKPRVGGPQTAQVVGPDGDPINVDSFGRVKVRFFWDRVSAAAGEGSCWVRVSQAWADAGFGSMLLPRVGEEVIVDFLEGDPDRPIITGRVHNAQQMSPYALPDDKTKSTWKSKSVKPKGDYDGAEDPPPSDSGFNEIGYEDKGGSEQIFVHAQRDLVSKIRRDEQRKTGRDTTTRVGRDRKVNVKNNETLTVEEGDETREISKGSRKTTIMQNETFILQQGDETISISKGSRTTTIEKNDAATLNSGDWSVMISKGQGSVEAAQKIQLKVGESTLTMTPTGIELKATMITIKADAMLSAQSQAMAEVKAGAMLTINGTPIMIN